MLYGVNVLLDSITPTGSRLTTFELKFPRFILPEILTHRSFSRNTASSRAIPVSKIRDQILNAPAIPLHWGKNKPGMSADEEIPEHDREEARDIWLQASQYAHELAGELANLGLHKQIVNRLMEPFVTTTMVLSATDFDNFFELRCADGAQPEMQWLASQMKLQYVLSEPTLLKAGEWHIPFMKPEDAAFSLEERLQISVGRLARVSYLTHDGVRDPGADIALCSDKLRPSKHWSPFEHVAQAMPNNNPCRNFKGWAQYRSFIDGQV